MYAVRKQNMKKPKILLSNDDGIFADGLQALYESLRDIGDLFVIAPDTEQSAVGHAITLYNPLRVKEIKGRNGFQGYAVNGTPADCVKLGIKAILNEKPDLVVSGINRGSNLGKNIIYSGTVSVATEGVIMRIPSIAFSITSHENPMYEIAADFAAKLVSLVLEKGLPEGTLLNVNVPNLPQKKIKGLKVTRQGESRFDEIFQKRTDPRNDTYFWMDGVYLKTEDDDSADDVAIDQGYISITPINYDLTNYNFLKELKDWEI